MSFSFKVACFLWEFLFENDSYGVGFFYHLSEIVVLSWCGDDLISYFLLSDVWVFSSMKLLWDWFVFFPTAVLVGGLIASVNFLGSVAVVFQFILYFYVLKFPW